MKRLDGSFSNSEECLSPVSFKMTIGTQKGVVLSTPPHCLYSVIDDDEFNACSTFCC